MSNVTRLPATDIVHSTTQGVHALHQTEYVRRVGLNDLSAGMRAAINTCPDGTQRYEREEVRNWLVNNRARVEFVKADGETRVMHGTLDLNLIPKVKHPKEGARTVNLNTLTIYDLDLGEWRSFRIDRLMSFAVLY